MRAQQKIGRGLALAVGAAASLLSGCAQLPSADADIDAALRTADPRGRLDLLRRQGERISGIPFIGGNEVDLLRNGPATYRAMEAAIDAAKTRIDLESYLFDSDEGAVIADHLLARRAAGVEVNLIYDGWGSMDTPAELFQRLRQGGVRVLEFNPLSAALIGADVDHRDHRKLLVIDSTLAFTGGINIAEFYERRIHPPTKAQHELIAGDGSATPRAVTPELPIDADSGPWRDTDVLVRGPAVTDFEHLFVVTWRELVDNTPALHIDDVVLRPAPQGELMVQAIGSSPEHEEQFMYRSLLVAISLARSRVHLTTGFFAPTPELDKALRAAARRGVDVQLLLPSVSTSPMTLAAGHAYYEDLLEAGVRIYECRDAVLHAKTAVIDGDWSTVGSSNLDWRSVNLNNEINAVILGSGFGAKMEKMFQDDILAAEPITLAAWKQRPVAQRIHEWSSRLFEYFL